MKKDYRNTEYCSYNNIAEMKESLKNEILNKHPGTKIIYNKITKKDFIEKFEIFHKNNLKNIYTRENCINQAKNFSQEIFEKNFLELISKI